MRSVNDFINEFINALRHSDELGDIKIIKAYPSSDKPTVADSTVIAVGIDGIELENMSIGSDTRCGNISIFADIYTPERKNSNEMPVVLSSICSAASGLGVVGIKANRIEYDDTAKSYVLKSVFTFNDEIRTGGEL